MNGTEAGLLLLMPALMTAAMLFVREVRNGVVWSGFGSLAVPAVIGALLFQRGEPLVNGPLSLTLSLVVVPVATSVAACRLEAVRRHMVLTLPAAPLATLVGVFIGIVIGVNGGLMEP